MEDCSSGDNRTVFAALPCLASGRSMVAAHGFSTGSYQSLNAVVASVLFVIGMGGRMLYVYLCCGRDEKKGARRLGRNMLYGLFWGAGLSALCTNVVVVSLFWLNACFTSADKTCDYRIIAAKVHDRRPKSVLRAIPLPGC